MFPSSTVSKAYTDTYNANLIITPNNQYNAFLDKEGNTPLHQEILKSNLKGLKELLKQEMFEHKMFEHSNNEGRTPLLEAINIRSYEIVCELLKAGASPEFKSKNDLNAIQYATQYDLVDILMELLKYAPSYQVNNDLNYDGKTPLDIGVLKGYDLVVELLLDQCVKMHMLEEMSRNAWILAVMRADPKKIDTIKGKKNLIIIKMFLDKGANPSLCDKYGRSLLHLAVMHENEQLLKILLDGGADWTITNRFGQTPLELASHKKLFELVKIIDDSIEAQKYISHYKYQSI